MTWTCTRCRFDENSGDDCKCFRCRADRNAEADKPAGLSEEENIVLGAFNSSRAKRGIPSLCVSEYLADAQTRNDVRAIMEAARAPLEAENAKLRERLKAEEERSTRRHRCIVELEAQLAQAQKRVSENKEETLAERHDWLQMAKRVLGCEFSELMPLSSFEVQSRVQSKVAELRAQKPAAPAGLPESLKVGDEVEVVCMTSPTVGEWEWRKMPIVFVDPCGPWYEWRGHRIRLRGDREGKEWRRIPPAQTSREPGRQVERAIEFDSRQEKRGEPQTHPMSTAEPAAFPPGEVSTERLNHWRGCLGSNFVHVREAFLGDMRANVERETAKWEQRLQAATENMQLMRHERDEAIEEVRKGTAEVERLKGELKTERAMKEGCQKRLLALAGYVRESGVEVEPDSGDTVEKARLTIGKLKVELERAKAAKFCPADGMSAKEIGLAIYVHGDLEDTGKKARELFTPSVPAQIERKDGDPGAKGEG